MRSDWAPPASLFSMTTWSASSLPTQKARAPFSWWPWAGAPNRTPGDRAIRADTARQSILWNRLGGHDQVFARAFVLAGSFVFAQAFVFRAVGEFFLGAAFIFG